MIPSETEPGRDDADHAAKEEIEAKVSEVCESCASDVNCGSNGNKHKNKGVNWGSSGLVTNRDNFLFGER
jgi:hypothetical protein